MSSLCDPVLIPFHPISQDVSDRLALPPLDEVFADFRTARPGQPVGLSLGVTHNENMIVTHEPPSILVSQGPHQEFENVPARDALHRPELADAMTYVLYAPSCLQDPNGIRWVEYGWESSSPIYGYSLRTIWIFPKAALVMNDVHECYIDDIVELAYLCPVMFEPAQSNHDHLATARYLDALLAIAATAAVPDLISEWPEDAPRGTIPFAPVDPAALTRKGK